MTLYPKLILDALAQVRYPGNGKNLVEAGMVDDDIRIDGQNVSFSIRKRNGNRYIKKTSRALRCLALQLSTVVA